MAAAKESRDDKPEALSAFLSPPSRIMVSTAKPEVSLLSPYEVSQKIASMLRPGPPFYSTVSSADLIDHLSNASIMNGEVKQGEKGGIKKWFKGLADSGDVGNKEGLSEWTQQGNVWSNLDSLPSGSSVFAIGGNDQQPSAMAGDSHADDGLWSSIMLSCDFNGENVELSQSCVVPTHVLDSNNFFRGNTSALFANIGAGTTYKWDDWSSYTKKGSLAAPSNPLSLDFLYVAPSLEMWTWPAWLTGRGKDSSDGNAKQPAPPAKDDSKGAKRIWVPSTTKVSVHARWWGYTIYIPKAVMPELDDDVAQAEKIANIVNKVLTTVLSAATKLPLPAPLTAALHLLSAIAPATSYISTFIGWSWGEIKSLDNGKGVELSATWLLPIALIPHSWNAPIAPADDNKDGTPDGPPVGGDGSPATPGQPKGQPAEHPAGQEQPTADVKLPVQKFALNDSNAAATPAPAPGATLPPSDPTDANDGGLDLSGDNPGRPDPTAGAIKDDNEHTKANLPSLGDTPAPTPPANNDADDE